MGDKGSVAVCVYCICFINQAKGNSMKSTVPGKDVIDVFVDAGSENIVQHTFVSEKLNEIKVKTLPALAASLMAVSESDSGQSSADSEKDVHFRLNQTGNIFYSTTSPELQDATKKLFNSVTVLFGAMTKALAEKNKSLFDYDAWSAMISKSGYFIEVQKFENSLTIESGSLTIDTQIVQQLLPGLQSGSSMEIAKSVLSALGGEYRSDQMEEKTKLGHLLFICEELFGSPSVTARLFFASKETHKKITSSPCHTTTTVTIHQLQEADTFLFVSPDTIAELAGQFANIPEAYKSLIDKLSSHIDGDNGKNDGGDSKNA